MSSYIAQMPYIFFMFLVCYESCFNCFKTILSKIRVGINWFIVLAQHGAQNGSQHFIMVFSTELLSHNSVDNCVGNRVGPIQCFRKGGV